MQMVGWWIVLPYNMLLAPDSWYEVSTVCQNLWTYLIH